MYSSNAAEAADQVLAIYREHAVRAHSLSVWKPMLRAPVLCKEWKRHNLPICDLTEGLKCVLEKGWVMKDADSRLSQAQLDCVSDYGLRGPGVPFGATLNRSLSGEIVSFRDSNEQVENPRRRVRG